MKDKIYKTLRAQLRCESERRVRQVTDFVYLSQRDAIRKGKSSFAVEFTNADFVVFAVKNAFGGFDFKVISKDCYFGF